ncbi:MAG: aminotransferase class III-fold pyridoxal phosphate-dependent enzyme [Verrucomicrobia bacterium]|nr:aminotransferase class III-fold pyridoxal phosphate-dependent enzyme [Verrucomicrobiota bacterium]
MKELFPPAPPPIVHNQFEQVRELFQRHVAPTYARFELAFTHGAGSYLWDVRGRRYLDMGGGIAVCSLGHAHPEITETLIEQSRRLLHVSNLYYHEPQGRLAQRINRYAGPGRVFFCNSGAEANEGLYKLARKFGHDDGRFEILTALNSFHGRTLGGIAATGQDKVKKDFEPPVSGFRHIPFNDLAAAEAALSPATVAILIEGVQGESGINPAHSDYLLGLRRLCDEQHLLLLIDGVQCGHFRTGRFQSFQRILEGMPELEGFRPDGYSMAKSLGGGFPIGAFWIDDRHAGILGPGTHGTTFGGTPLGCAIALKVFEVIEREKLDENARRVGEWLRQQLDRLAVTYPSVVKNGRGLGFLLGLEIEEKDRIPAFATQDKPSSLQLVQRLHEAGLLTIPSGTARIRFLPALNLGQPQAEEAVSILESVLAPLAA